MAPCNEVSVSSIVVCSATWMQCSCAATHQQANRVAKISISSDEPPGEKLNCSACLTWKTQHNQMEQ